jgi:protein-L-isoaspartate(D-aspartate) O-methyltransferase
MFNRQRVRGSVAVTRTTRSQALLLIGVAALVAVGVLVQQRWSPLRPADIPSADSATRKEDAQAGPSAADAMAAARLTMVERQLRSRDISDERVLNAMRRVPRHRFVPSAMQNQAYDDGPLPIGHGQTISQPYIVALMTQLVRPEPGLRALDVGTGSGYQAAVLAELVQEVFSIEIVCPLADEARDRLAALGYENVTVRCGDGYQGWKEHAPFDVIVVAAAPDHIPQPLLDQLAPGGRLVIPVGDFYQELRLIEKRPDGRLQKTSVAPVRFVPMTGEARER